MTQDELRQVLDEYFEPLFQMLGGAAAVIVVGLAVFIILGGAIRRLK